jgi:co-chaperonin GroES (HSP10)
MLAVTKKNTLVKLKSSEASLGNGLVVNTETQNRKDIVYGEVVHSHEFKLGDVIYFPLYASSKLSYMGEDYYIVNNDDIIAYEVTNDTDTTK